MSAHAQHEGKSLDAIISENRKAKSATKGRAPREPKKRDAPYPSSSNGAWKHDKHPEAVRTQKPVVPQKTEEELGYKVSITNCPLTEEELKTLLEGSELKFVRVITNKKIASLFFSKKEDADKAVADFDNQELLGENGPSAWAYVPWAPREPRQPKEHKETRQPTQRDQRTSKPRNDSRAPKSNNGRPQKTVGGSRISANDIVISVRR